MDNSALRSLTLANFLADLRFEDLPNHVITEAKRRILDYFASAYAGRLVNSVMNAAVFELITGDGGKEESSLLFSGKKVPAGNAAFVNAVYGHGADIDDGHKTAMGHPGVTIIPAVLALAEARSKSAREIITAVVAGYEVYIRLSNCVMPGLFNRGFHGTGIVGAVASSAACAKVLGYDADKIHRAISFGALHSAGLFNVSDSGQMSKPINPGHASHSGVFCALLAGIDGAMPPEDPFEGPKSFFHAYTDDCHPDELIRDLGRKYMIETAYIKLYPACRHMHPAVDAGAEAMRKGLVDIDKLTAVKLYTYQTSIKSTGLICYPKCGDEAKFSIRYALACALTTGNYSFANLEKAAEMPDDVRHLIDIMEVILDETCENKAKGIRGSRLELVYSDRPSEVISIPLPKGEPELPLNDEDMRNKLTMCSESFIQLNDQNDIFNMIMDLENIGDISVLLKHCK